MSYRKLRIAWSVAWGVLAVLLCVLWLRSYRLIDTLVIAQPKGLMDINSFRGHITCSNNDWIDYRPEKISWNLRTDKVPPGEESAEPSYMFARGAFDNEFTLSLPTWCPFIVSAAIAMASWLPWRFSLRTLLIATTLVAMLLGLVIWMLRVG